MNHRYRVPAVRHLDWICHAPALMDSAAGFRPAEFLPDNLSAILRAWDENPESGPAVLTDQPARRLGHYFESLYQCLMEHILGWEVLLKNQPVRSNGLTLGELDFIVRNPLNQRVEHHEIAVKFYLGYHNENQQAPLWYGPNSRDRLDLKTHRLLTHQSRLTDRPETRELLSSMHIPAPARARIFMPGYLFYPAGKIMGPPADVPTDHLRGEWIYIDELDAFRDQRARPEAAPEAWVPLVKPHWLGPWSQDHPPDRQEAEEALEMVRSAATPRLFALLKLCPDDGQWRETSRLFVVPADWPGQKNEAARR